MDRYLTGKYDGISIQEYLEEKKTKWYIVWKIWATCYLKDDVRYWWESFNCYKMKILSDKEFEQVFLDKGSHAKKKENARSSSLSSSQVHRIV